MSQRAQRSSWCVTTANAVRASLLDGGACRCGRAVMIRVGAARVVGNGVIAAMSARA